MAERTIATTTTTTTTTNTSNVKTIRIKLKNVRSKSNAAVPVESSMRFSDIGHLAPKAIKDLAKKRKAELELEDYVGPSATVEDIVNSLKPRGGTGVTLPARWDSSLELPSFTTTLAKTQRAPAPSSKRPRCSPSEQEVYVSKKVPPQAKQNAEKCETQKTLSSELTCLTTCEVKDSSNHPKGANVPEDARLPQPASSSDHATSACLSLPVDSAAARQSAPSHQDCGTSCSPQGGPSTPADKTSDWRKTGASLGGQPVKTSSVLAVAGSYAQAGKGAVLPLNFLSSSSLGGSASSILQSFLSDLELSDLSMPVASLLPPEKVTDEKIGSMIRSAAELKRLGDQQKQEKGNCWRVGSLSKYVEASLLYMEACMYMARHSRNSEWCSRAASLYSQTAELLTTAAKLAEFQARGNGLGKETLRVLCERLAAICWQRESVLQAGKLQEQATRVNYLLAARRRQQSEASAKQRQGHVTPSPSRMQRTPTDRLHNSPGGSNVSSHDHVAANTPVTPQQRQQQQQQHNSNVAAELGQAQSRLVSGARKMLRYTDMLRRSTSGFQAVIERPKVQDNHFAKLACVHIAAIFMNAGMGDGMQLLAHARQALTFVQVV